MHPNLAKLANEGQSVWIDAIRRGMLTNGELQALIDDGVVGLTSNPSIFQKAIADSDDYRDHLEELVRRHLSTDEIYEGLVFEDIGRAADLMEPVYRRTKGQDGFVSIEVNPNLAYNTSGTVEQGRRIFQTLKRPNVMIKVPGTAEGIPAIEQLLSEGINVNVTLIFSVEVHRQVMRAYVQGMRRWDASGGNIAQVASVASFFVSRIDTVIDQQLERRIAGGESTLQPLLGQAAIANARIAYAAYQEVFERDSGDFADLRRRGARVQRPLWASTSTKNPRYRETYYVDTLVGPYTVNTVPPTTLNALRKSLELAGSLTSGLDEAKAIFVQLAQNGIDIDRVTADLQTAGVKAFADSFSALMKDLAAKQTELAASLA